MATKISDILESIDIKKVKAGTVPYVEIGDIDTGTKEIHSKNKPSVVGAVLCPARTIIISRVRPNRGAIALVNETTAVTSAFTILKPDESKCLLSFLYYYLAWNENFFNFLQSRSTGITYPTVKEKEILSYEITFLPNLAEQKRIVAILEEAESLKKKRAEADKKTEELIPALFEEMFGSPSINPMEWPAALASTFLSIKSGFAFKSSDFVSTGVPLIKIGTINKGYFDSSSLCFLPERYLSIYEQFVIFPGDLLITLTGTAGKDDYGNTFVMPPIHEKYLLNQRVAKLETDSRIASKEYFRWILKDKTIKNAIIKSNRGVRQGNLNNTDLLNLLVPIPPIELQNKFAEFAEEIEIQKNKQVASGFRLEILFAALLSCAFAGKL